jgi:hypothetical protein
MGGGVLASPRPSFSGTNAGDTSTLTVERVLVPLALQLDTALPLATAEGSPLPLPLRRELRRMGSNSTSVPARERRRRRNPACGAGPGGSDSPASLAGDPPPHLVQVESQTPTVFRARQTRDTDLRGRSGRTLCRGGGPRRRDHSPCVSIRASANFRVSMSTR